MKYIIASACKIAPLAAVVSALLSTPAMAAAPGKPSINWMNGSFSLLERNESATSYAQAIKLHDSITIPVSWQVWSGEPATSTKIYFDDKVVFEASGNPGQADVVVTEGGLPKMTVELCNNDGCSKSDPKDLVIGDNKGSHLTPLHVEFGGNHKPYENKSGKVVGTYFVEWTVYDRKFFVKDIPAPNLTHILYGFVPMCGGEGINDSLKRDNPIGYSALMQSCAGTPDYAVVLHDLWAAVNSNYEGGFPNYDAPIKGNMGQLMRLKKAYPHLKILPSVGGWTLTDPFHHFNDPAKRAVFVNSVKEFLKVWQVFDGVDIDWEHPGGGGPNPNPNPNDPTWDPSKEGELYVTLMKELRDALDELSAETGKSYEVTSAYIANEEKLSRIKWDDAARYMDHLFLMSYDYYGAWSNSELGYNTSLYAPQNKPNAFNTDIAVKTLLQSGMPADKINVGVASYGRGWTGVSGYQGDNPFTGTATGPFRGMGGFGHWEPGIVDYKAIAALYSDKNGYETGYDDIAEAAYVWNREKGDLVTYDNDRSIKAKGKYVLDHGLGGLFSWELDGDNGDNLNAMHEGLGHGEDGITPPPVNKPPVANAGKDLTVTGPAETTLDGSASYDPENSALTYRWKQLSGPPANLMNADQAKATAMIDGVETDTDLLFELTVTDDQGLSAKDTAKVLNKAPAGNQPPVVTVPSSFTIKAGEKVSIEATASDPDGDALTYHWTVPAELNATGQDTSTLVVTGPNVTEDTRYQISVMVSDGSFDVTAETTLLVTPIQDIGDCETTDPEAGKWPAYQQGTVYNSGDTVSHNSLVWKAKWWTQNVAPGVGVDVWQQHSQVEMPWSALAVYTGGSEVNHKDRRWKARWWTQGAEPKVGSDVWQDIGESTCD
ncbi:glycosyl hydrolase family 18 protein [Aeromonas fluvialis]|uniref:glycosyl hydrolase family 18 protein n=1 Tax=Aeromonas fluvialis TaxID=591962 RepID=UPI0005A78C40|nr:glycosyl hydrolase family 18 protein [Aeromonas fluvialis]